MLIDPQSVLRRIDEDVRVLTEDTLKSPPPDYAGFIKAVGKYMGLQQARAMIIEAAKLEDDK